MTAVPEDDDLDEDNDRDPSSVGDGAFRLHGVRVLVVEDEPDTRALVADCLERFGASVLAVPCAEDALSAFAAFDPHLVLSDLSLPRMSGWDMLRALRSMPGGSAIPALALSASATFEDASRALEAGFDAHLAKPVSLTELVRAVSSMIR